MLNQIRRELWLFRMKNRRKLRFPTGNFKSFSGETTQIESLHILATGKADYAAAAINCANSYWKISPNTRVILYVDGETQKFISSKARKIDKISSLSTILVPENRSWQELKLWIILEKLGARDLFCDADLIWNGNPGVQPHAFAFVREFHMSGNAQYVELIRKLDLDVEQIYMYNTSVVYLSDLCGDKNFSDQVWDTYVQIVDFCGRTGSEIIGGAKTKRLAEQIALSIGFSILTKGELKVLKEFDSPMDGGIAESYYLGTTKGWN